MTYGIARAATSGELELFRTPGKKSIYYAAIKPPRVIYTARVNQVFTSWDNLLSIAFDGGVGTLANVHPDMIMYVGTTPGARDVGFLRIRDKEAGLFYVDQYSGIKVMDDQYLTVVDDVRLLQRHINIVDDVVYMDGTVAYTNQHSAPAPTPIMGNDRIVEMIDDTVDVQFNFSQSYVIDGTSISTKVTSCPTAISISGSTTYTPTITFDAVGWHAVYLTLTGANGAVFEAVRWIFVYDKDNLPARVKITESPTVNVNDGGWSFGVEMYRHANLDDIYEGALTILFSIDYWGDTQEDICLVPGSEKIECWGWIASPEKIKMNPERGSVSFSVQGPHYWLSKISAYPDGVNFKISDPTDWTQFKNLTIDKGVWHFLHWRTTLTRRLDFFPSGDNRYSPRASSLAEDLWSQIREMTDLQILARPGFNALGQLFIQINPQLIPDGERDFATVLDIQKSDWIGQLDFDRVTVPEVSDTHRSGIVLDSGGNGLAYFAVAPGNTKEHYGRSSVQDKILISSQEQIIDIAGLSHTWLNNPLPNIPVPLKFNTRLIDCFPNQKCTIMIDKADNVRGVGYTGGLIPVSITVNYDDETGRATRFVEFEAETFKGLAIKEEISGSGDVSVLPDFTFPSIPPFDLSLPGTDTTNPLDPKSVWAHDTTAGFLRCDNFNAAPNEQEWYQINGGLSTTQYQGANFWFMCPNGAFYVGRTIQDADTYLARAAFPGGAFTIIENYASMVAKYGPSSDPRLACFNFNPLVAESVIYFLTNAAEDVRAFIGSGITFDDGATMAVNTNNSASVTYGLGYWMITGGGRRVLITPDGMSVFDNDIVLPYTDNLHVRVGTSGITYNWANAGDFYRAENNMGIISASLAGGFRGVTALDYTGTLLVSFEVGATAKKSSDEGSSFSSIGTLPVAQVWAGCYVGGAGTDSCWIMVSDGGYIYYSDDFFIGSPIDKRGNLADITPFPHLNGVGIISRT